MPAIAPIVRGARRLVPLALAAYRHWDQLSPAEKERYRQRARGIVEQAKKAARRG